MVIAQKSFFKKPIIYEKQFFDCPPHRVASCAGARGPPPKSLDSDENFKPDLTLFCRELRFGAIFGSKTVFFGQEVHYYMVYIAYFIFHISYFIFHISYCIFHIFLDKGFPKGGVGGGV